MSEKENNVVLHVGLPKAGSTFLQKAIFPNISDLFFLGRDNNNLVSQHLDYISWRNPFTRDLDKVRDEIDEYLSQQPTSQVLFSREAFFGNFYTSFVANRTTAEALNHVFPSAKVLIVLRRQDRMVESAYKQALHQGHSVTWKSFLGYRRGRFNAADSPLQDASPVLDATQLDWYQLVKNYHDFFGRENVLVLPQEMLRKDQEGFLKRFYGFTGFSQYYPAPDEKTRINRGYSYPSALTAIAFNRFLVRPWNSCGFIPEKPFWRYFNKRKDDGVFWFALERLSAGLQLRVLLQKVFDKILYIDGKLIPERVSKEILMHHCESNRLVAKMCNLDLSKYGYYAEK